MITVNVPGFGRLELRYLVFDYNGTMAVDGGLLPGVASLVEKLAEDLEIHVLTADTFGLARENLKAMPVSLTVLPEAEQDRGKREFVRKIGPENTAAIGNGRNDSLMLKEAAVGVCLIQKEGASGLTLSCADVVCRTITDALELLLHRKRLVATLRC